MNELINYVKNPRGDVENFNCSNLVRKSKPTIPSM